MDDLHEQDANDAARPRNWKRLGAASAAAAVSGATVLAFGLAAASPAGAEPGNSTKYWVCKFVTTPGSGEILQTGNNPISVAGSSINEDPVTVGTFFNDQQGRSFVFSLDTSGNGGGQSGEPSPEQCLAVLTPPSSSTPPPSSSAAGSSSVVPPPVTVTETAVAAPTSAAAAPVAVEAGQHSSTSGASLALGSLLLALGLGGVLTAVRPWKRGTH